MIGARNPEWPKVVRFSAAFAAVFLGGCWLSGWQYALGTSSRAMMTLPDRSEDVPPMPTITTPEEFDVALKSRRSVFFVDADWSPDAVLGRRVVYPLVRSLKFLPRAGGVSFFRIDVTERDESMWEKLRTFPGVHWLSGSGQLLFHRDCETIVVECAALEGSIRLRERLDRFSQE